MANYCATLRTNYFKVNDEDGFRKFMDHVMLSEDQLHLWEKETDGQKYYGFGGYGGMIGYVEDEEEDFDYSEAWDGFVKGLQRFIADDDAVIIMEVGNEKLRYLVGLSTIITREDSETIDLTELAADRARELLGYSWNTVCEY